MHLFLLYLFLFIVGCFLGWIIEVFFRRLVSAKKWVNPGFMKGPWLPLYGFGMVTMFLMCHLCLCLFPKECVFYNPLGNLYGRMDASGPTWYDLLPIFLMGLSMNALEFIAGLIFIKGFKVKLWDYTNMKGNILGIVCPVFALIWFAVATLFYYGVNPFLYVFSYDVYDFVFGEGNIASNVGLIFLLGLVYGVFIYDLVGSIGLFASVAKFAKQSGIVDRYETLKDRFKEEGEHAKAKLFDSLPEHVKEQIQKGKDKPKDNALKDKLAEMIYIDPEKEKKRPDNYDENGRPIKDKGSN